MLFLPSPYLLCSVPKNLQWIGLNKYILYFYGLTWISKSHFPLIYTIIMEVIKWNHLAFTSWLSMLYIKFSSTRCLMVSCLHVDIQWTHKTVIAVQCSGPWELDFNMHFVQTLHKHWENTAIPTNTAFWHNYFPSKPLCVLPE